MSNLLGRWLSSNQSTGTSDTPNEPEEKHGNVPQAEANVPQAEYVNVPLAEYASAQFDQLSIAAKNVNKQAEVGDPMGSTNNKRKYIVAQKKGNNWEVVLGSNGQYLHNLNYMKVLSEGYEGGTNFDRLGQNVITNRNKRVFLWHNDYKIDIHLFEAELNSPF